MTATEGYEGRHWHQCIWVWILRGSSDCCHMSQYRLVADNECDRRKDCQSASSHSLVDGYSLKYHNTVHIWATTSYTTHDFDESFLPSAQCCLSSAMLQRHVTSNRQLVYRHSVRSCGVRAIWETNFWLGNACERPLNSEQQLSNLKVNPKQHLVAGWKLLPDSCFVQSLYCFLCPYLSFK